MKIRAKAISVIIVICIMVATAYAVTWPGIAPYSARATGYDLSYLDKSDYWTVHPLVPGFQERNEMVTRVENLLIIWHWPQ